MKQRKIDEEFLYEKAGEEISLKIVEGHNNCEGCFFDTGILCGMNIMRIVGPCIKESRSDYRDIIVVKS